MTNKIIQGDLISLWGYDMMGLWISTFIKLKKKKGAGLGLAQTTALDMVK